ncbi:predicted protein [Postia placenta Mad-698-R]|nr:predicted protein [Postia placenta Mad-698-R]
MTIDPTTGEVSDDASTHQSEAESREGRQWGQRTHSPSPSVVKFAANIAQRVGSLVSSSMSPSPRSHTLPTDDELEAEAEKEREKSRREAERIMQLEAEGPPASSIALSDDAGNTAVSFLTEGWQQLVVCCQEQANTDEGPSDPGAASHPGG